MELYRHAASASYLLLLVGVLFWGARETALRPESLLLLKLPRHRLLWLPTIVLIAMAAVLAAAAVATGFAQPRFASFILAVMMGTLVAAAAAPGVARLEDSAPRLPIDPRIFAVVAAAMLAWSFFSMPMMARLIGLVVGHPVEVKALDDGIGPLFASAPPLAYVSLAALVLAGAIQEEVVFRGALQGSLANTRLGPQGAVVVASLLFAFAHGAAYVDPPGMKEAQIFGLGLIFGTVRERHGLRGAAALHLLNNGLVIVLNPFLQQ